MFGLAIYSTTTWLILGAVFAIAAVYVLRLKWGSRQIDDEPDSYQTIDLGDAPGQIAVQPWMVSPETSAVFDAIEAAGGEIRFVGGCVRDAVLKRTIKDIDLATSLLPEASQKALEAAGLKVIPTGIKHGTVTCISGGQSYEITTLRLDEETDGRHATVAFTDDWKADASRRDFTMNALSMTREGIIYDYFNGLRDLAECNVMFIGDPNKRIEEDYLRILRFFRFIGGYGTIPPFTPALSACRRAVEEIDNLSGERIRQEMMKILAQFNPTALFGLMADEHILERLIPVRPNIGMLQAVIWLETRAMGEGALQIDPVRRLAAMLRDQREAAVELAERWRLSNDERDVLLDLLQPEESVRHDLDDREFVECLYRLGSERFADHVLMNWAYDLTQSVNDRNTAWRATYEKVKESAPPRFPIAGRDVVAAGIPSGPAVGQILKVLEKSWIADGCKKDREALLVDLDRVVAQHR